MPIAVGMRAGSHFNVPYRLELLAAARTLLTGEAWPAQRTSVCRTLGRDERPALELTRLAQELDARGL